MSSVCDGEPAEEIAVTCVLSKWCARCDVLDSGLSPCPNGVGGPEISSCRLELCF